MFFFAKTPILCTLYLCSVLYATQADNTLNALKEIKQQLTEFKLKYENEQRRVREFVSTAHREYQEEACYNATIETFVNKNDLDPYGNINLVRIELHLDSILNHAGKFSESTERTKQEGCECEKANGGIQQKSDTQIEPRNKYRLINIKYKNGNSIKWDKVSH